MMMHDIGGLHLQANSSLIKTTHKTVTRTWKQRLFTLPWTPMKKYYTIEETVIDKSIYRVGNSLVAHPAVIDVLIAEYKQEQDKT